MSSKIITHVGRVAAIESGSICVAIEVDEACSTCSARSACTVGGGDSRIVRVDVANAGDYAVGDSVEVAIRKTTGFVAVALCYVVPLILLVSVLAVAIWLDFGEGVAAMAALLSLALYYAGLALMHGRISKKVIFTIKNRE